MTEEPVDEPGAEEAPGDVVNDLEATVEETERLHTGIPSVDSVVDDVANLVGRPVEEHSAVFEAAHERLRRTLDDPDAGRDPEPQPDPEPEPDREP
jgi:hypothetical protein